MTEVEGEGKKMRSWVNGPCNWTVAREYLCAVIIPQTKSLNFFFEPRNIIHSPSDWYIHYICQATPNLVYCSYIWVSDSPNAFNKTYRRQSFLHSCFPYSSSGWLLVHFHRYFYYIYSQQLSSSIWRRKSRNINREFIPYAPIHCPTAEISNFPILLIMLLYTTFFQIKK